MSNKCVLELGEYGNLFYKQFFKFCTFRQIFNDNAAINYVTVQYKKDSFSSLTTIIIHREAIYNFWMKGAEPFLIIPHLHTGS